MNVADRGDVVALPAKLSERFGSRVRDEPITISITSALAWSRRSARDWNAYLTARAAEMGSA